MLRKNKDGIISFHGYMASDYANELNKLVYKEGQTIYVVDRLGSKYILENLDIVEVRLIRRFKHGKKNNFKK